MICIVGISIYLVSCFYVAILEDILLEHYAHSLKEKQPGDWQSLEEHLLNVAKLAEEFAKPFGGEAWARLAGLWHDLGKYSNEFQKMLLHANGYDCHLETKPGKPIHSLAGGHLAQQKMVQGMERIFCWLIMGHHTGLADYGTDQIGLKALEPKMRNPGQSNPVLEKVPDFIKNQPNLYPPMLLLKHADVSFFTRMLFSCLVDADYIDTEAFMDQVKAKSRIHQKPNLLDLLKAFDKYMDHICAEASPLPINKIRANVLNQCRQAAKKSPGVFTLTVPTGGGKTLSSMAFALRHAVKFNKNRIIYVIPYTSIIEQNADVFRKIPGFENAVLEHHSNVSFEDESKESVRSRLASENWDAPIIVTTSVQFFESLYACKTSRCRKLHNIANSVVIFDEAQCLPLHYLRPIVFAIRELQRFYGVTPVLCTATQPVLTQMKDFDFSFKEGFDSVVEIIEDSEALTATLQRVEVQQLNNLEPLGYEQLADCILSEDQSVLCIVNKKQDARILTLLLPEGLTVHLSTNMCAQHRTQVLNHIRDQLISNKHRVIVVSTSLVEAGVDLDFPVVYRALAGLDSIAQAAGRCNREGKLLGLGKMVVFVPEEQPDYVQAAASLTRSKLNSHKLENLFSPKNFTNFFKQYYMQIGHSKLDSHNILSLLGGNLNFYFRSASSRFHMIDDSWQLPLIIPFGLAPALVDSLLDWNAQHLFRKLQRYTINISKQYMWQLIDEGHARELPEYPGTYFLSNKGLYSERFGFVPLDKIDAYDPEDTMI